MPQPRILMVDDQEANLLVLDDILDSAGYANRRSILDSRQVCDAVREYEPDIILLDLMMPHLDGVDVLEQLRPLLPKGTYLPTIVLTADVTQEARRRVLSAGAHDFLTKPFDEDEVLLRVKNLLATRYLYLEQQQHADEKIRESEQDLADFFENAVVGLHWVNPDGCVLRVNKAELDMLGYSRDEIVGQHISKLHVDKNVIGAILATIADGQMVQNREAQLRCKDGTTKQVLIDSNARWENGTLKHTRFFIRDITEVRNLESQLCQAQKMEAFGQLAGGVAHDFNNLLTVITGFSEMILSGMFQADRHKDMIREIHKASDRAASLTRQLLAFSRKQMLQPVELDLNSLVSETEKMLRRLIGADIDLATRLDPALGRVKADPGQIEQVIMNLVVNARDAMPRGGHLTIETKNVELDGNYARRHAEVQPGNYVMLAVTDSGCGMDQATRAKIFEPFFTTKEVGKGTGLGLATVHGIVKQSGGSIEVHSEVGKGTTFKVYLPRINAAVSSGKSTPGISLMPQGTETILLAEDEEGVRATVRLALESNGYTVLAAKDGEEAVQVCRQHTAPIHLLMTDVVMPKMSGRQLVDLVVGLCPSIKVLYLSGYTDDAVVRHGVLEAGMAFLQKPFTPMLLTRKVREVLDGPARPKPPSQPAAPENPPADLPRGNGEWVLVVDDERSIREIAKGCLEAFGYRVLVAVDGTEAVVHFAAHPTEIAAVLTDMKMPHMDGSATMAALRRMKPDVRIIAMSGREEASGSGAADHSPAAFLPKPFTAEQLLRAVKASLPG